MTGGTSGTVLVPWITAAGDTFELHAGPSLSDPLLASITVAGVAPGATGAISASPNPCTLSAAGTCSTTLTWSTANASSASIWVRAGNEPLKPMTGGTSGTVLVPWITAAGDTFELHAGPSASDPLLALVKVRGSVPDATGVIGASPNPCILSAAGTCTTTLGWETNGVASASIYVRAGSGPLMPMTGGLSGTAVAPWITAAGNTFELHAGPLASDPLLASVVVNGVMPN
jgi:hypothetical protein